MKEFFQGFMAVMIATIFVTIILLSNKILGLEKEVNYLNGEHVALIKGQSTIFKNRDIDTLKLKVDILTKEIYRVNKHISTQNILNKEMLENAKLQLRMNELLSKRIDSK